MPRTEFTLSPDLDVAQLTADFAANGRVRVPALLASSDAQRLHEHLRSRDDWRQVLNSDDTVIELSRPDIAALSEEQRQTLDNAVYAAARTGFQYRFETLRVPDDEEARAASGSLLADFASWLSSGTVRDLLRQIVGVPGIAFADAQGTAYSPGDFLTGHDDVVSDKSRFAAYVFGASPVWRIEWGGALLFHEAEGRLCGQPPGFNTLDLFRVGQMHSVSEVTRAAAYRRYSITGWLRGQ